MPEWLKQIATNARKVVEDDAFKKDMAELSGLSKPVGTGPERGALGEIGAGFNRGLNITLPAMVGDALKYTSEPGKAIYETGENLVEQTKAREDLNKPSYKLNPEAHNGVTNALASGADMIPSSLAPAAVVAGGIMAAPFEIPALAALGTTAALGSLPAALSQGQQSYEAVQNAGGSEADAKSAGRYNALIEGGMETAGTFVGAKFLGKAFKIFGGGKVAGNTAESVLAKITKPEAIKAFVKEAGKTYAGEVGTEMIQGGGQSAVERAYGVKDGMTPGQAALSVVPATIGMTTLMLPFGGASHAYNFRRNDKMVKALEDGSAPIEHRIAAAGWVEEQIAAVDPEAAKKWIAAVLPSIDQAQGINIGDPQAPTAPVAPTATPAGPAADSSLGEVIPGEEFNPVAAGLRSGQFGDTVQTQQQDPLDPDQVGVAPRGLVPVPGAQAPEAPALPKGPLSRAVAPLAQAMATTPSILDAAPAGYVRRPRLESPTPDTIDAEYVSVPKQIGMDSGTQKGAPSLDALAHQAATSPHNDLAQPTDAQKEAGNYKVGAVKIQGLDISIENPAGSERSGKDPNGKPWSSTMNHHYGYIKGTVGFDKDHLDTFLGKDPENAPVAFVVDQRNKNGSFDEHKVVLGASTMEEAKQVYLSNYATGWDGLGAISAMPMDEFKTWAKSTGPRKGALAYKAPSTSSPVLPSVGADQSGVSAQAAQNLILPKNGQPYKTHAGAVMALKSNKLMRTHEVSPNGDGFALTRKAIERDSYADPRLKRTEYRDTIAAFVEANTDEGSLTGKKMGEAEGSIPSLNLPWAQEAIAVAGSRKALVGLVKQAAEGQPLTTKQGQAISLVLDEMARGKAEAALPEAQARLAKARHFRQMARWTPGDIFPAALDDDASAGRVFNDDEYNGDWSEEMRTLAELSESAREVDEDATIDILAKDLSAEELARRLYEITRSANPRALDEKGPRASEGDNLPRGEISANDPDAEGGRSFHSEAQYREEALKGKLFARGIGEDDALHQDLVEEQRNRDRTPDRETGLIRKDMYLPTMERAWAEHKKTGRDFAYGTIDFSNLGGVNAYFGGEEPANPLFRSVAATIDTTVKAPLPSAQNLRQGGDEFSTLVPDIKAERLDEVLSDARDAVDALIEAEGLSGISHAKGGKPGVTIYFDSVNFSDYNSFEEVKDAADRANAVNKERHHQGTAYGDKLTKERLRREENEGFALKPQVAKEKVKAPEQLSLVSGAREFGVGIEEKPNADGNAEPLFADPVEEEAELFAAPAKAAKPLNIGDTFEYEGLTYELEDVTGGKVLASDIESGAMESWPTIAAFEKATGQKINFGEAVHGPAKVVAKPEASANVEPKAVFGADNKLVSIARADELRAKIRSKLNNINAGVDPEMIAFGTELAVHYIEGGARSFVKFSRKMVAEIGEAAKPYLKSWYMGAKYFPNLDTEGMDTAATVESLNVDDVTDGVESTDVDAVVDTSPDAKPAKDSPGSEIATISARDDFAQRLNEGTVTLAEYKAAFASLLANKESIVAELTALTKNKIFDKYPGLTYRYKNDAKPALVNAAFQGMVSSFNLGRSVSYAVSFSSKGDSGYGAAVQKQIDATTDEELARYAAEHKASQEERTARVGEIAEAIKDPKTLDDFKVYLRATMDGGMSFQEARLTLSPKQRADFDSLAAEVSRSARKDQRVETVRSAGQTVDGEIIETTHTQKGHALFVVQLAERVSKEDYTSLNTSAKKLGGYYSSFRGRGAIPGFQFKTRDEAEAFKQLAGGDTTAAQDAVKTRRDSFADDRSQSAVERLREMAGALNERASAAMSQDRKTNTDRRARMASSAEAQAGRGQAFAQTMENLATAIENGTAKLLDLVRQKVQVEYLSDAVRSAHWSELRVKHPTYSEQQKHEGDAPTAETADYAEFPMYTAYRSDLASLGRQLLEVDGTKKLGAQIMKVADDVTSDYLAFAKENAHKVATFIIKDGGLASFASKPAAEAAIKRSGYKGRAIVLQVKRNENLIILSPSEAQKLGVWEGDNDKRITLNADFGAELVTKIGRTRGKVSVPHQFETAHYRRSLLQRMGIETASEFRAALREFIGLVEKPAETNKIKELERAMVGRRKDGLDFFPTPEGIADEMIQAAGIEPGMAILEPSGGWGHIAERIREAGTEPDVVEISSDRRELLEAKGFTLVGRDFMDMSPRGFTWGDTFKAPDGKVGVMRMTPHGGMGSDRRSLVGEDGKSLGYYDLDDLTPVSKNGTDSGYDRIIMNPPFSDRRDAEHVQHAFTLLKPGGRIVAIMGEGVFFGQDKKAKAFRDWLEEVSATDEKLAEGTFLDPLLPVNTGVNTRMVVIDKPADAKPVVSAQPGISSVALAEMKSLKKEVDGETAKLDKLHFLASTRAQATTRNARAGQAAEMRDVKKKQLTTMVRQALEEGHDVPADILETVGASVDYNEEGNYAPVAKPVFSRSSLVTPFYSKLKQVVDAKMGGKMPVDQIRAMLKGNQVTDDEITHLIGGLSGVVTKAQVIEEIAANSVEFDDVVLGEGDLDLDGEDLSVIESSSGWGIYRGEEDDPLGGTYGSRASALEAMREMQDGRPTHFFQYTEPGAVEGSYREMFVTAPQIGGDFIVVPAKSGKGFNLQRLDDGSLFGDGPDGPTMWDTEDMATRYGIPAHDKSSWRDGHGQYDPIKNPIVRIRFNERTADGKRLLFVEEMQGPSDANQQKMPEYLKKRIYDIGIKRVLAYAKENGFDGVAWTTGEMQANRYDLSKSVKGIEYSKNADGTFWLSADLHNGGDQVLDEYATPDKLAELVGKEVAKKIVDGEGTEIRSGNPNHKQLSGLDLKVGGEGLKALYDRTLPNLFKKYGKESVGTINLQVPEDNATTGEYRAGMLGSGEWAVRDDASNEPFINGMPTRNRFRTESEANAFLAEVNNEGGSRILFIPLTAKTPEGFPQFSSKGTGGTVDTNARKAQIIAKLGPQVATWKDRPSISVVEDESDLPAAIQTEIREQRAEGQIRAVYYEGRIFMVAANLPTDGMAEEALLHEAVGHYGFRKLFGKNFTGAMAQTYYLAVGGLKGVKGMASRFDIDLSDYITSGENDVASERITQQDFERLMMDELLAHMAGKNIKPKLVARIMAAIREGLRALGFERFTEMNDADILRLIAKARDAVVKGKKGTVYVGGTRFAAAWHGSPHTFEKFTTAAMGTGEGAQAYGWGLYFAGRQDVARHYKEVLGGKRFVSPDGVDIQETLTTDGELKILREAQSYWEDNQTIDRFRYTLESRMKRAEVWASQGDNIESNGQFARDARSILDKTKGATLRDAGSLYQVELAPAEEDYLLWDKPLSEQSEKVKKALAGAWLAHPESHAKQLGAEIYGHTVDDLAFEGNKEDTHRAASELLRSLGIRGIKYLDGSSRGKGGGDFNYVIFSDDDISITARFSRGNPDIRFAKVDTSNPAAVQTAVAAGWQDAKEQAAERIDYLRMKFQDKFLPLKRAQEYLTGKGWNMLEGANAYLKEELSHGKAEERLEKFQASHVKPLTEALKAEGVSVSDLEKYLYARHAPERNAYIAEINPAFAEAGLPGSGMFGTVQEKREALRINPSAEIQAMPVASEIMGAFAHAGVTPALERLAVKYDALTTLQRKTIREAGMETEETVQAWERYKHYVPLKGQPGDVEDGFGRAIGRGANVRKSGVKKALGRKSLATNLLGNTVAQTMDTMIRAEKAEIGKAFLLMVEENPDRDMWITHTKGDHAWPTTRALVNGQVKEMPDHLWSVAPNILAVTRDGEIHYIEIKNDDLARVMGNLNPAATSKTVQVMGSITRLLSRINTSLNPEFIVTNFERDLQTAMINLSGEHSGAMAKKVVKGVPSAIVGIRNALRGDKTHDMAKWYDRFKSAGGKVGFMDLNGVDAIQKSIESDVARAQKHPALQKTGKFFTDAGRWINDYNTVIENAVRLSSFKVAIEGGATESEAASLAKNLTVNFNRKGELSSAMNSAYMFFNAGVQGSARIVGALRHPNVRKVAYGVVGMGIALAEMARLSAGADDDDKAWWDKLDNYTKETHLIYLKEDGSLFKVKMPYGYNVFVVLGYAMDDAARYLASGGKEGKSPAESMAWVMKAATNAFNPMGGESSLAQFISPTVLDPFIQVSENKNFFGGPVMPSDNPFGPPKPDSQKYFSSVREPSKKFAAWLNDLTGGTKYESGAFDLSPETIDHFYDFVSGGMGRFVADSPNMVIAPLTGDVKVRRVPFLRKVYQDKSEYVDRQAYVENADHVAAQHALYKDLLETGPGEAMRYLKAHPKVSLSRKVKAVKSNLRKLRAQRNRVESSGLTEEQKKTQLKALDQQMNRLYKDFNKTYGGV